MKTLIFKNRMPLSSWALILAGFVIAGVIVVAEGNSPLFALAAVGGLAVVAIALVLVLMHFLARNQVAEAWRDGDRLEIETFSMLGRGRQLVLPVAQLGGWRWFTQSVNGQRFSTLAFTHAGREYRLPLNGAKVVDRAAFAELAPEIADSLPS